MSYQPKLGVTNHELIVRWLDNIDWGSDASKSTPFIAVIGDVHKNRKGLKDTVPIVIAQFFHHGEDVKVLRHITVVLPEAITNHQLKEGLLLPGTSIHSMYSYFPSFEGHEPAIDYITYGPMMVDDQPIYRTNILKGTEDYPYLFT